MRISPIAVPLLNPGCTPADVLRCVPFRRRSRKSGNRLKRLDAAPPPSDGKRGKIADCASFSFSSRSTMGLAAG
jgi:hypothetical protein